MIHFENEKKEKPKLLTQLISFIPLHTESCFRHPLFDLRGTRKVEIRHTNFHFSSKKVTSKSRKVEVFDLTIVKKLSTFRPKKAKVEKLKSRKVEKLKSRKVEKLKSGS